MVSEDDGPQGRCVAFPAPALGGHEAENRHSEGARARPAGAADERAVRQARRPDPKQVARGTERDSPADPRDGRLRNAQPPGGPDPRRPCRRAGTCASQGQGRGGGFGRDRPGLREVRVQPAPVAQAPRRRDRWRTQPLNSVESRGDTVVPKDAGKVLRLRQVRLPATLRYAMLLAALLGLWQIYVTFVGQISLPGPLEVAGALSEGWSDGRLAAATWMTLGTLALGMLIGAMIAVSLSVFAAWIRIGSDLLTLLTLMLYPVPAIALLSLLILWFDTSPTSLVVVTVCSVTLPTAINLSAGLKSVNPTIMLVGHNLGVCEAGGCSAQCSYPQLCRTPSPDSEQAGPPAGAPYSPPDSSSALQAGGPRSSPTPPATSCRHRSSSQDYLPSPSPASWSKRPSACWSAVPASDGE